MMFFVLPGAIGFCVFMVMCVDNMLTLKHNKIRELVLIAFVGVVGIISRIIPQPTTFTVIAIVSLVVAILLTIIYRSLQKGVASTVFLTALLFGVEGITLLITRLFRIELGLVFLIHLYIAVVLVIFLLFYLLRKFLETRKAMNILNNQTTGFLLISAGLVLVFTYKGFALEETGIILGGWTVGFGDIANILFILTSVVMFIIILRYVSKEAALRTERLLAKGSKKYLQDLEESHKVLRIIKHDYVNILTTFKLYIDNEDMPGLKKYYYDDLSQMNKGLLNQDQLLGNLQNISLDEIKSILIYKGSIAKGQGIDTKIEIKEPIDSLGVSTAIVCQMLGILLDNAIEATNKIDDKRLHIAVIKNPTSKVFIVKNTWENQGILINKLYELGFSTKGEGRGLGLHTARNYTEKLRGLFLETEATEEYFTQTLTVKDD
jgi:two-component system sensor histidine kinase AgrC